MLPTLTKALSPGAAEAHPFDDQIAADLTDALLQPIWLHFVSAGIALIAVSVLGVEVGFSYALTWGALGAFAYGSRLVIVLLYRRSAPAKPETRRARTKLWLRRYYPSTFLLGIFWGGTSVILTLAPTSASDGTAALILFMTAWMMAGAVMTHSVRTDTVDTFIWPAAILVMLACLGWSGWPYRVLAALAFPYAVLLRLLSMRLSSASVSALRGQYEKAALADKLMRANAEVREASRAKSQFLANMSHELRTPLNAIIGFSEIMAREILGPIGTARYQDYAQDIHGSGKHLLGVINDILDLSRIEAGEMALIEEECDLAEVLSGCIRLLSHRAAMAEIAVVADFGDEPMVLRADIGRVRQIGLNLLANAIKFTPRGGQVRVSVRHDADGGVVLTMADTGIGMRPEDIRVALTPFQQVETAGELNRGGTGLGLPLTKTLVELHGGSLEVESELGQGTIVSACFPSTRAILANPLPFSSQVKKEATARESR